MNNETVTKASNPALLDNAGDLLNEAKRYYDEAHSDYWLGMAFRTSALHRARVAGEYLLKAKTLVKHGEWEGTLAKFFGEEKIRRCQDFMRIADEWGTIERAMKKNPDLSIDGALKLLRPGGKAFPDDPQFRETLNAARELFAEAFPKLETWTDEDLFVLQTHFTSHCDTEVLRDQFSEGLQRVCAKMQSRVRKFAALRIGLDDKRRKEFMGWRAEQRQKEAAEGGPMVFGYTKPSDRHNALNPVLLKSERV